METRQIVGNLAADPDELRETKEGRKVIDFRVAVKTGKHTEFTRVIAWEKQAEFVAEYLRKGDLVSVRGITKTRSWEDKDGVKRYVTELHADGFGGVQGYGKRNRAAEENEDSDKPF